MGDVWSYKCNFLCVHTPYKEPIAEEMNNNSDLNLHSTTMHDCRAGFATVRSEGRQIVTTNGSKEQSLPIYNVDIHLVDEDQCETVEVTGSRMQHFTIKRPIIF